MLSNIYVGNIRSAAASNMAKKSRWKRSSRMHVFELFMIYIIVLYNGNKQFVNMERMQAFQLHAKPEVHEKYSLIINT